SAPAPVEPAIPPHPRWSCLPPAAHSGSNPTSLPSRLSSSHPPADARPTSHTANNVPAPAAPHADLRSSSLHLRSAYSAESDTRPGRSHRDTQTPPSPASFPAAPARTESHSP